MIGVITFLILLFVAGAVIQIFIVKTSARIAYGKKVGFGRALLQWALIFIFQMILWAIAMLGMVLFGVI